MGRRKKTLAEFVAEARKVHGDKYDYSRVEYTGANIPVCIICPEHGEFWQAPSNHILGAGCAKCHHDSVKSNTEAFIQKAKELYGDRYDYSKAKYVHSKEKLCVICPEHGEFWTTPNNHLRGHGCPGCYGTPKKSLEEFIREAREVHGDRYDYSQSEYITTNTPIKIICPEHGEFWKLPYQHINGAGCPACNGTQRIDKKVFLERAPKIHNNKYDYSLVDFKSTQDFIQIICPEHGIFTQKVSIHLRGYGCQKCGGGVRLTNEEFIEKAKAIHGDKYGYEKTQYVNTSTKVCIICKEHGEFWQVPNNHLFGAGCPKCAGKYNDLEFFIERARKIHGDKYDYSKSEYKGTTEKLCIICPEHGEFWKTPSAHMLGQGCPKCSGHYIDTEYFKERAIAVHGDKYDYSLVEYKSASEKVKIICPQHGVFEQMPFTHLSGAGCPICNQSHLENDVMKLLKRQNIQFIPQKSFDWLIYKGKMYLDFFLPEYGVAIECQGEQHFEASEFFGGEEAFIETQKRDEKKEKLCNEHSIAVLYYSDLGIDYPYPVIENPSILLAAIYDNESFDPSLWKDPELPFDFD